MTESLIFSRHMLHRFRTVVATILTTVHLCLSIHTRLFVVQYAVCYDARH